MNIQDFDAFAAKFAGVQGAAVSMRHLQGSWPARVSMAVSGSLVAYYASPYLSLVLGIPEGLAGFLMGMFGMAIVSRHGRRCRPCLSLRCGRPSSTACAAKGYDMDSTIYLTLWAVLGFVCWFAVAGWASAGDAALAALAAFYVGAVTAKHIRNPKA